MSAPFPAWLIVVMVVMLFFILPLAVHKLASRRITKPVAKPPSVRPFVQDVIDSLNQHPERWSRKSPLSISGTTSPPAAGTRDLYLTGTPLWIWEWPFGPTIILRDLAGRRKNGGNPDLTDEEKRQLNAALTPWNTRQDKEDLFEWEKDLQAALNGSGA